MLFWNVRGHNLSKALARLAASHSTDLVILAERSRLHSYSGELSNRTGKAFAVHHVPGCAYLHVVTTLSAPELTTLEAGVRHAILRIQRPSKLDVLLALAHLPPKGPGPNSADNQRSVAEDFHQRIQFQETFCGHRRTIVVGDLNMNPFETGITSSKGLHAVSAPAVAQRVTRTVNGKTSSPIFLNPMWGHWRAASLGPPGSYYKGCTLTDCLFWHIFDQVLLRHDAGPLFVNDSLQILRRDGQDDFLSAKGIPKGRVFSDHLPVVFNINV